MSFASVAGVEMMEAMTRHSSRAMMIYAHLMHSANDCETATVVMREVRATVRQ